MVEGRREEQAKKEGKVILICGEGLTLSWSFPMCLPTHRLHVSSPAQHMSLDTPPAQLQDDPVVT